GIERFGQALEGRWGTSEFVTRVAEAVALSTREVDAAARLVAASYATFRAFPLFAALSMFYFAAASHTEMARRVSENGAPPTVAHRAEATGTSRLSPRVDHPSSGTSFDRLTRELLAGVNPARGSLPAAEAFTTAVRAATEPLNVAGLCDSARRNWYPID